MKCFSLFPLLIGAYIFGGGPARAVQAISPEDADFTATGREVVVDDVWFRGCYHNAFEGTPVKSDDGKWKSGEQGIQRTKAVLTGAGSTTSAMTLEFELKDTPKEAAKLVITGVDDGAETSNELLVTLNDQIVEKGLHFRGNQNAANGIANDRYLMGWEDREVVIPAGVLRKGRNTLVIANTTSCLMSEQWNYAIVDQIKLIFGGEVELRIPKLDGLPVLYYGLGYGPEVNAWPAVNLGNRMTLLQGAPLQVGFFVTVPTNVPLGKEGPLADQKKKFTREIVLHLETDADLQILTDDGHVVERPAGGGAYVFPLSRLLSFETPHPAQGVTLFFRGGKPFDGRKLTAWVSIDGVSYRKSQYDLSNISLEPLPGRDGLNFDLGIWGGQIPSEPKAMQEYIKAARDAGFNQLFTGENQDLNTTLKKAGFHVYPRYGWFAHQFKVTDDLAEFAAVDAKGQRMPEDFCPLAILAHADHPEIGKFFERARKSAHQTDIDGICVDYETPPVWCYCDKCLAKFREETGQPNVTREDIRPGGAQADAFVDYGRRRNRDLLAKVKETIQKENPKLQYHALASASDIPSYWYDGRTGGRHSVRELTSFADAIYASAYFYENPGGLKSVIPIVETVSGYAHNSGREVGTYLISPVATTISEFPRYRGTWMKPDFTKLLIQVAGFGGARGVLLFRGDCLDGEYFAACREALASLLQAKPYLEAGINRSYEVTMTPIPIENRVFDTQVAQHLLSRLVWHPSESYEYDVVQLLDGMEGRKRLVALFNYSDQPREYHVAIRGLFDPEYVLTDFSDGKSLGTMGRIALEDGQWTVKVPARSCRLVEIAANTP